LFKLESILKHKHIVQKRGRLQHMTLYQEIESYPHGNLCTTTNTSKTTDYYQGGKENKEISQKQTCVFMTSGLAYLAIACVERPHSFLSQSPVQRYKLLISILR
jgi:hypothetical protein